MEFVLTGFRQNRNVRHYSFQAISDDRTRKDVTVGADLSLMLKHRIPLQELPLLCRRLLQGKSAAPPSEDLMFTEQDMLEYAADRATAAQASAQKRRAHPVPTPNRTGQAWRSR